jgi:uncharacterized protein YecE (DUF72 family)
MNVIRGMGRGRAVAHIGTSGWSYSDWQPELYPPGLPTGQRLARYAESFDTVELNSSFYRWPPPTTFASWRQRLPAGFQMSVKAPRGLTHARKLAEPQTWIERIAAGLHELDGRRAVLLVQLGPGQARDDTRLDQFLGALPAWVQTAVEFRHPSWVHEDVFALLARHRAAYCVMSGAELPCVLRVTAPFAYLRLHGPDDRQLYAGSYSHDNLAWWADHITEWEAQGTEVFAYFNNDAHANAVRNARTLQAMLGQRPLTRSSGLGEPR